MLSNKITGYLYHQIQLKSAEQRAFWNLFILVWGGCFLMFSFNWIGLPMLILIIFHIMGIHIHNELNWLRKKYNSITQQKYF